MRQKATPTGGQGFAPILIVLLVLFVVGLLGYFAYLNGYISLYIPGITQRPYKPTPFPLETPQQDFTSEWKSFKSITLGLEFKTPPILDKYGSLSENISPAEKGTYLCIVFPPKKSLIVKPAIAGGSACDLGVFGLQANSVGFEAGRSGLYLDIQGFEFKNGIYYYKWVTGTDYERQSEIPGDVAIKYNDRIVKLRGLNSTEMTIWPSEGTFAAIINTGNRTYPGLVLSASTESGLTEEEFDLILSTFKFTQ